MPKFMVVGADAETAEDRALEIQAESAEAAADEATASGLLVHRTYQIGGDGLRRVARDTIGAATERADQYAKEAAERSRQRAAAHVAYVRQLEERRFGLRADYQTVSAIASGVLLGLLAFALLGCVVSMLIPGLGVLAAAGN